ncbi:MAG: alpha/beta hydrolase, partial [Thermomicrobiales bacterium]
HKWVWIPVASMVLATVAILLVFNLSPRPGAAMIRYVFTNGAETTKEKMEPFAPVGITVVSDQQYRPDDDDAFLDVYFPDGTAQQLPTLIWTHGGAWISGNKEDASPYFKIISAEGYTVISLEYSLGPGEKYPTAIHQVNDALAYIQANAAELHVDPNRIMMAGDSAGAQITSQYAAIVTNPEFATEMEITPSLKPEQLRGVLLFCGIYDLQTFMDKGGVVEGITGGILQWGSRTSIWAYTGTKDSNSNALLQMSSIDHVTAGFPPTFITGGNGDPLTDHQSIPLASTLRNLGVETVTLFFEENHEPSLGHEYQFELEKADAQDALAQMLDFMKTRLAVP